MTKPFSWASYQKQLLWLLSKARNWISSVSLQHFWYSVGVSKISHLLTHWDIHLQFQAKPTGLQKSQKFVLIYCLWCSQMFQPSISRISHPFCSACSSMSTSAQLCAPLVVFSAQGCVWRGLHRALAALQTSSRCSAERLLNNSTAGKKRKQNISMAGQPHRNTSTQPGVGTELQVKHRATGWCQWRKHREKYIFQRRKKKGETL